MSAISTNSRSRILRDNFAGNKAEGSYDVLPCPARDAPVSSSCLVSGAVDTWLSPVAAVKGLNTGTFSEETAERREEG